MIDICCIIIVLLVFLTLNVFGIGLVITYTTLPIFIRATFVLLLLIFNLCLIVRIKEG